MDLGQWARTVIPKKESAVRSPPCKFNRLGRKTLKQQHCSTAQNKPPKCYIKITGSRYNGTFLLNIDDGLDDAIYHTMKDIEVALEGQTDPTGKPKVSPKNCLSSVFQCFGTHEFPSKTGCGKKKPPKAIAKPAECTLTGTVNKTDLGPLMSVVQSNTLRPTPENSSERVMREVVDVFRSTLDQFRRENQTSSVTQTSEIAVEQNCPTQVTATEINKANEKTRECIDEGKKLSLIRFSQEEVLVIQPPKPSVSDNKQLEVGIEVRPKFTATNVGQSIKIAKDKVLIGVEDGRGVLQINEGVPKRSLQMVIEEGRDGKPSVKVSLMEEDSDKTDHPKPEDHRNNKVGRIDGDKATPKGYLNRDYNVSVSASTMTNGNEYKIPSKMDTIKNYKSVESQVSWASFEDKQPGEKLKFQTESTQSPSNILLPKEKSSHCGCCEVGKRHINSVNGSTDVSQDATLQGHSIFNSTISRFNRIPYLVNNLCEPRSLQNSTAYSASDTPSMHFSIRRTPNPKKLSISIAEPTRNRYGIEEPNSFSFSSDYSSSSKCTRIFRDIEAIEAQQETKENVRRRTVDASVADSHSGNFEKILQDMCGPSYFYHQPEQPEPKSAEPQKSNPAPRPPKIGNTSLLFDQWTQTCCVEGVPYSTATTEGQYLSSKVSRKRESGDSSRPNISRKKGRRATKSSKSSTPRKAEGSSASISCSDDMYSSDSSRSKKQLVFSMLTASEENPLPSSSSGLLNENWTTEKAASFVGQKIFAAIGDYTDQTELSCCVDKNDSFLFPTCHETSRLLLHGSNTVSVVNLALYEPMGAALPEISEEDAAELYEAVAEEMKTTADLQISMEPSAGIAPLNEPITTPSSFDMTKPSESENEIVNQTTHQAINNPEQSDIRDAPSYPIRVKSNSCQNLMRPRTTNEITADGSSAKKVRYPHLTTTDDSSFANVCGILNHNEGGMKVDQSLVGNDLPNTRTDQALPSAIQSLLLPQPPSELDNCARVCTFCCNRLMITNASDSVSGMLSYKDHRWCFPRNEYDSATQLSRRRGLFKRTFIAVKTVRTIVTRKFSTLFHKLPIHSKRKRDNVRMTGSLPYVAIPLEKKSENLQLYPEAQ